MQDLKKEYRLRENFEFRQVYRRGRSTPGKRIILYKLPVPDQPTRIGFVTGKKVGSAVQRNRARRLMREVYRRHRNRIADGYLLVLIGRAPLAASSYWEAEREILQVCKRAKILT